MFKNFLLVSGVALAFASCSCGGGQCPNAGVSSDSVCAVVKDTTAVPSKIDCLEAKLVSSKWKTIAFGADSAVYKEDGAWLEFDTATNKVSGNAGCNIINASYVVNASSLQFLPGQTTMMACPDLDLESKFTSALNNTASFLIEDDVLVLKDSAGISLMTMVRF